MNDLDNRSHIPELDDWDNDNSLPEVYMHIYVTDIMSGITILILMNLVRKNILRLIFKNPWNFQEFVYLLRIIKQFLGFLIRHNFIFFQAA